jgi:hypothetical protein
MFMSTKKKLLIALLSATCLTAGVFGLSACGDNSTSTDGDATTTVANGKDGTNGTDGATWLTGSGAPSADSGKSGDLYLDTATCDVYKKGTDAWSKIANIKGATGATGDSAYDIYLNGLGADDEQLDKDAWLDSLNGDNGAPGKNGDNGVGISKVEYSSDGKYLLVYYTNSTTPVQVAIPQANTHEHVFGDVTVLVAPTTDKEGIGFQTCSADGYNELVVIPKLGYQVTVYLEDGTTPAEGAEVTIGTVTHTVGANGVADFSDIDRGEYDVSVSLEGYKLVETVDTSKANISIVLTKVYSRYHVLGELVTDDPIATAGKYVLTTEVVSYTSQSELQLTATEDTVYTISGYNEG